MLKVRSRFFLGVFAGLLSFVIYVPFSYAADSTINYDVEEPFHNLILSYPWERTGVQFDRVFVAYSTDTQETYQFYFNEDISLFDPQGTCTGAGDEEDYSLCQLFGLQGSPTEAYMCRYDNVTDSVDGCFDLSGGESFWFNIYDSVFFQYGGYQDPNFPERASSFGIPELLTDSIEPYPFADYDSCDTGDIGCHLSNFLLDSFKNLALFIVPVDGNFTEINNQFELLKAQAFEVVPFAYFAMAVEKIPGADISSSATTITMHLPVPGSEATIDMPFFDNSQEAVGDMFDAFRPILQASLWLIFVGWLYHKFSKPEIE